MADLVSVAQSGVDPTTGSYLSSERRKALFRFGRSRISSNKVFGGGGAIVPIRSGPDPESLSIAKTETSAIVSLQKQVNDLTIRNNQLLANFATVGILQKQLDILKVSVTDLGGKLQQISGLISTDTKLEQQETAQEQERDKKIVQKSLREGKESALEKAIQSALIAPAAAIAERAQSVLGSLMQFFGTLFVGWLTDKGIKTLRALTSGNTKKLEEIKDNVIKNLGIIGGIFLVMNLGIFRVIGSIIRLGALIGNFVLKNTVGRLFAAAGSLIGLGGGAAAAGAGGAGGGGGGGKPGGGKPGGGIGGLIGKGLTIAGGIMDVASGQNIDATLAAGAAFAPGALKIPFGLAYGADAIAEMFGGNLFGKNPNEPQTPQTQPQPQPQNKPSPNTQTTSQPTLKPQTPPVLPTAQPQTPVIPASQTSQQQTTTTAPAQPSSELVKKFEMAWQYRNNPMARGRIEGEWSKMSPEQKQMAVDWAKSKGYDWNEMRLQSPPAASATSTAMGQQVNATQAPPQISPLPTQVQKVDTVPFNIGPEPEPKPNIVYTRTSSGQQNPVQGQPLKQGEASEVPMISSSNHDNVYILYSHVNYNVVM